MASNGGVKIIPKTRSVSVMSMVTSRGFLIPVARILSPLVEEFTIHGCRCRLKVVVVDPMGMLDDDDDEDVDVGVGDIPAADVVVVDVVVDVVVVVVVVVSGEVTMRVEPTA